MRSHTRCDVSGMAGAASTATMRSASSASPMTVSTAGPAASFHGSFASRYELVARINVHVDSRARLGCTLAHAAAVCSYVPTAAAASELVVDGRGPTPPHFLSTTVATRER